jgi:hypothetical protein
MDKIDFYGVLGIVILIYSIAYLLLRIIVITDFSKREFKNKELKIYWRKRLYSFIRSQIAVYKYFILYFIKNEND